MAPSARLQQLLDARKASSGFRKFGGPTRVLSSLAAQTSQLAKNTLQSELQNKVSQYNDGLISNEDMNTYLNSISGSNLLSPSEKVDVSNKIRDMEDNIRISKLEATYKNAPDGSPQQLTAANALSNFYNSKASSLQPDTPAASDALSKAGQWAKTASSVQDTIQKNARSLKRAQLFNAVAQTQPNSVEEAMQKAQAYSELAAQARADGDETAALQLDAKATDAQQQAQVISDRLDKQNQAASTAANKKQLNDYINSTINDYHDGKITGEQAIANLQEADKFAADMGDTGTSVRLNSIATGIYRDMDKGVTYSQNGAFGEKNKGGGSGELVLNADGTLGYDGGSSSGGSGGSKGGAKGNGNVVNNKVVGNTGGPVSLSELDRQYQDEVKKAHQYFLDGQTPDGKRFNAQDYTTVLAQLAFVHQDDLQKVVDNLSQLDPNAKVMYHGQKVRIEDLTNKLTKTLQDTTLEANKFSNGDVVPVMTVQNRGKAVGKPTLQLISKSQLPNFANDYVLDSQGVAHQIQQDRQYLTAAQVEDMQINNPDVKIKTDTKGRQYITSGVSYTDVYDTAGNRIRYQYDEKYGYLPVIPQEYLNDPNKSAVVKSLQTLRDNIVKQADATVKSGKTYTPQAPMTPEQLQTYIEGQKPTPAIGAGTKDYVYHGVIPQSPMDKLKENVASVFVPQKVDFGPNQGLTPPLMPEAPKAPVVSAQNYVPPPKINIPAGTSISNNQVTQAAKQTINAPVNGLPVSNPVPVAPAPQPKIQLAAPTQTPLQKAVQQNPSLKVNVQNTPVPPVPKPYTWSDLGNTIKNLGTKIFSIFKK